MSTQKLDISYETSSKEAVKVRSRIFVGGINTSIVSRDDVIHLFGSYGNILGVTLFNKYAFIQYSTASEADLAISALNMYYWHGSALDVKLVAPEKVQSNGVSTSPDLVDGLKKQPECGSEITKDVEGRKEVADLFVCGCCRFATSCLQLFVEHRKKPCEQSQGKKAHEEPNKYECNNCLTKFDLSWDLLDHLSGAHNLTVFREVAK